jgi:eukaryotic-like serine/threonine-protein kinase
MKKIIFSFLILFFISACQASETPVVSSTPTATNLPLATATSIEVVSTVTASPTPENEAFKVSSQDGMVQIYIPAGEFMMGGLDVYRENDELPAHVVKLGAYWMDAVEVTNGMYNLCVQANACRPPAEVRSDNREFYFGNVEFQDYPVISVTWFDASAYCVWAERRLPSEAEWEYAARGADKRNFPWGDEPPNELLANSQNFVGDTSRVGSYAEGASPFGVLDLAGNVWEWVADRYRPDYYTKSPLENPLGPSLDEVYNNMFVIRGGSFQDDGLDLRLANRNFIEGPNFNAEPDEAEYYGKSSLKIGFRCVQDE